MAQYGFGTHFVVTTCNEKNQLMTYKLWLQLNV